MDDYATDRLRQLWRGDLETQVTLLRGLVVDLMTEVEALRATQLAGTPAEIMRYRRAYETTVLQSHNSSGPYSGTHRVFWAWYGTEPPPPMQFEGFGERVRREVALLRRMGASEADVADHTARVEEHATRT